MKKYIFTLVLAVLVLPVFASAQSSDVDTSGEASCAIISVNLRYRSTDAATGGAVSILQDFLNSQGYLNSQPTGFFGSMTRTAVIAFQSANGLSSTPPGFVGAQTRAKIQAIDCNGATSGSAQVVNANPAAVPATRAARTDPNSVSAIPIPEPVRPGLPTQTQQVRPALPPTPGTPGTSTKPVPYLPPPGSPVTTICPTGFTCKAITGVETPPVPTIASLSPTSGPRASAVMITIYGSGFREVSTTVSFRGSSGEAQDMSPSSVALDGRSLKVPIPSNLAAGVYSIGVANLGNGWRVSNGERLNFTIEPGIRDEPYAGNVNPSAVNATTTPTPYLCPAGYVCSGYTGN